MTAERSGGELIRPLLFGTGPAPAPVTSAFSADDARGALVELLQLEPMGGRPDGRATWDDVVAYTAKALGTITVTQAAVRRRAKLLADAVGNVDDPPSWPHALGRVLELMVERKAVLAIHRPRRMSNGVVRCVECGEWGGRELRRMPWPCRTARAMGVRE